MIDWTALLMAVGIMGGIGALGAIFFFWIKFCHWVSDGESWGFVMAMSPVAVGAVAVFYFAITGVI